MEVNRMECLATCSNQQSITAALYAIFMHNAPLVYNFKQVCQLSTKAINVAPKDCHIRQPYSQRKPNMVGQMNALMIAICYETYSIPVINWGCAPVYSTLLIIVEQLLVYRYLVFLQVLHVTMEIMIYGHGSKTKTTSVGPQSAMHIQRQPFCFRGILTQRVLVYSLIMHVGCPLHY